MAVKFIKTGIPGFDDVLKGGLRENASVLITGGPGTGKTLFGLQFIYEGAKKGEAGLYITFEETADSLREYAQSLGMDLSKYEKNGMISIIQQPITTRKIMTIATPIDLIKKNKVKRAVLDSLTLFEYIHVAGTVDFRKEVFDFLMRMKEAGVTLIVTSQKDLVDLDAFKYEPQDFLFEGLIILTRVRKLSSYERCITVAKLRGQDHMLDIFPFSIGAKGVEIHHKELPFSLIEKDDSK